MKFISTCFIFTVVFTYCDASEVLDVKDISFQKDVFDSELPVLVDFWAEWCAPCRMLTPVVEEIAQQYDGRVVVVKVNIDEIPSIPEQYGIGNIPTFMIFKDGQRVDMVVGAVAKSIIANTLEKYLKKDEA